MTSLSILVPVLGRPHRVKPLLKSIAANTSVDHQVLFLCTPGDNDEIVEVLSASEADFVAPGGTYAEKINLGVELTQAPLLFFGADDLEFHSQWFENARAKLSGKYQVVGVNDLCNERVKQGDHATHFLVQRQYAERPTIDGERGPLCEQYAHWFIDDEFWATAKHRGVLAVASDSIVEHLHPMVGKGDWDGTYALGQRLSRQDRRKFWRRRHLWT